MRNPTLRDGQLPASNAQCHKLCIGLLHISKREACEQSISKSATPDVS